MGRRGLEAGEGWGRKVCSVRTDWEIQNSLVCLDNLETFAYSLPNLMLRFCSTWGLRERRR